MSVLQYFIHGNGLTSSKDKPRSSIIPVWAGDEKPTCSSARNNNLMYKKKTEYQIFTYTYEMS